MSVEDQLRCSTLAAGSAERDALLLNARLTLAGLRRAHDRMIWRHRKRHTDLSLQSRRDGQLEHLAHRSRSNGQGAIAMHRSKRRDAEARKAKLVDDRYVCSAFVTYSPPRAMACYLKDSFVVRAKAKQRMIGRRRPPVSLASGTPA